MHTHTHTHTHTHIYTYIYIYIYRYIYIFDFCNKSMFLCQWLSSPKMASFSVGQKIEKQVLKCRSMFFSINSWGTHFPNLWNFL